MSMDFEWIGRTGVGNPQPKHVAVTLSYRNPAPPAKEVEKSEMVAPPEAEVEIQKPIDPPEAEVKKTEPVAPPKVETQEPSPKIEPKKKVPPEPLAEKKSPPVRPRKKPAMPAEKTQLRAEEVREQSEALPVSRPDSTSASADQSAETPSRPQAATATPPAESPGDAGRLVEAKPLYRRNPPPQYPRLARRRGYEGRVVLEVLVDRSGKVAELRVFESSGHEILDNAAVKSVRSWQFAPARRGSEPVDMWVRVPVRFDIQ